MSNSLEALRLALLRTGVPEARLRAGVPMSACTTFRIGGPADLLLDAASEQEVADALRLAREAGVPLTVIGNGSNLLVRDGGIRGLVLRLSTAFAAWRVLREDDGGCTIEAQAGVSLGALAQAAAQMGLCGLAPLSGIPGTLGGGVIMNAGAYGGELGDVVFYARGFSPVTGEPVEYTKDSLAFSYRASAPGRDGALLTCCRLRLARGPMDADALRKQMANLARQRREKQPLEYPSAGSAFKRPEGHFAAKLIDEAGLRGLAVGGAQVSEKHAGFIVNRGSATARDVLALMDEVRRRVLETSGVTLTPEIRILGEDPSPEGASA